MTTKVEESIQVDVPLSTAYNQWTQFEDFPHFMGGVKEVRQLDDQRLHWVAEIAGVRREWEASILEQVPDQRVAWAATSGATNAGATGRGQAVTFALAVVPITLLLLGFPIFMVLLTAVTVALVFFMHVPLAALHQNLFASVNGFALLAIPFFIYAGELMGRGSVAQRLVDFVQGGVGSVRGSLGVTAVGTSAIFGAISGASAATVATIGAITQVSV